jgi:hypothetical protein
MTVTFRLPIRGISAVDTDVLDALIDIGPLLSDTYRAGGLSV